MLLSHNTTDTNRDRAYAALWERYDSPEEIMDADRDELAETISVAGLHNVNAVAAVTDDVYDALFAE